MRTSCRIGSIAILGALLSLAPLHAHSDPAPTPKFIEPFFAPETGNGMRMVLPARDNELGLYQVDNVTLNYASSSFQNIASFDEDPRFKLAPPPTVDSLSAKVSVRVKDASFLSALDAVMNSSPKTCRIECRQIVVQRVSLDVKEAPLAGLLDSLAKIGGARLYILPNKLIIAPEKALTEDEKQKAHFYGALLTPGTLPDISEAKALLTHGPSGKTILEVANTKIWVAGKDIPLGFVLNTPLGSKVPQNEFTPKVVGPVNQAALNSLVSFDLRSVNYGDALASFARLIGCELYLTPQHFIICAPDHLNDPDVQEWTQGAVPAFTPESTISPFLDSKWIRF